MFQVTTVAASAWAGTRYVIPASASAPETELHFTTAPLSVETARPDAPSRAPAPCRWRHGNGTTRTDPAGRTRRRGAGPPFWVPATVKHPGRRQRNLARGAIEPTRRSAGTPGPRRDRPTGVRGHHQP